MRLFGIYHLLCDHCNLLFTGFVVPGTLRSHHRKKDQQSKETQQKGEIPLSPSADIH